MIETLRMWAHRWLCRRGIHDWFRQRDRWGSADVCRYCVAVRDGSTQPSEPDHTNVSQA